MNLPLLWLAFRIKHLDLALDNVLDELRNSVMALAELPMGDSKEERTCQQLLLAKMELFGDFWESRDLGIALRVPGVGTITLNLAVILSVIAATAPSLWVFGSEIRMLPYLLETGKAFLIEKVMDFHEWCFAHNISRDQPMGGRQKKL
ncbi:hypothetical protein CYMTET_54181 [Cymbomonas tetramitiformis]|uniref:Uncharacterized protein n=1 Tax=Cymbomonas tetramitiformis TaxID=36881 RepID=A0AAE0EQZ7_9CHLO|nr:hypothetical protein CYMTET_54181 [Cymbomonas tetramitiformis]